MHFCCRFKVVWLRFLEHGSELWVGSRAPFVTHFVFEDVIGFNFGYSCNGACK